MSKVPSPRQDHAQRSKYSQFWFLHKPITHHPFRLFEYIFLATSIEAASNDYENSLVFLVSKEVNAKLIDNKSMNSKKLYL